MSIGTRQVDLIAFNAQTLERQVLVTCRLDGQGQVTLEGQDQHLISRLEIGVYSPSAGRTVTPAEGGLFLDALPSEFRTAYLFAEETDGHR